jgi:hypothetical protein
MILSTLFFCILQFTFQATYIIINLHAYELLHTIIEKFQLDNTTTGSPHKRNAIVPCTVSFFSFAHQSDLDFLNIIKQIETWHTNLKAPK